MAAACNCNELESKLASLREVVESQACRILELEGALSNFLNSDRSENSLQPEGSWVTVKKGVSRRCVNGHQNRLNEKIEVKNRFNSLSVENGSEKKVLVVGDSNIRRLRNPILDRVKNKNQIKIVGRSGAKVHDCESMVSTELVKDEDIKMVTVCVGTNDVEKVGSQVLLGKLRNLVRKIRSLRTGVDVAVCSLPSRVDKGNLVFSRSESVNSQLGKLCREERATWIDLRHELNSCRYPLAYDGVHFSKSGAELVGHRLGFLASNFLG